MIGGSNPTISCGALPYTRVACVPIDGVAGPETAASCVPIAAAAQVERLCNDRRLASTDGDAFERYAKVWLPGWTARGGASFSEPGVVVCHDPRLDPGVPLAHDALDMTSK